MSEVWSPSIAALNEEKPILQLLAEGPIEFTHAMAGLAQAIGLDYREAARHADTAVRLTDELGLGIEYRALALTGRCAMLRAVGRLVESEQDANRGLELVPRDSTTAAQLLLERGSTLLRRGEFEPAFDDHQEALLISRASGLTIFELRVEANLAGMFPIADSSEAVDRLESLLERIAEADDSDRHLGVMTVPLVRALCRAQIIRRLIEVGGVDEAERHLNLADVELGDRFGAERLLYRAMIEVGHQRCDAALAGFERSADAAETSGDHLVEMQAHVGVAQVLGHLGRPADALERLAAVRQGVELYPVTMRRFLHLWIDAQRAVGDHAAEFSALVDLRAREAQAGAAFTAGLRAYELVREVERTGGVLERTRVEAEALAMLANDLERQVDERSAELAAALERLGWLTEEYRLLAENTADVVARYDTSMVIEYVSPSVERVFGLDASQVVGHHAIDGVHPADRPMVQAAFDQAIETHEPQTVECRTVGAGGLRIWAELQFQPIVGPLHTVVGVHGVMHDITRRRAAEDALRRRATVDHLTGLPNRSLLTERLEALLRTLDENGRCAVCFIDVDRFKLVNDTRGHSVGDALLAEIAARLQGCLEGDEFVARVGGDEFVVVVPDIPGPTEAVARADAIRLAVETPWTPGDLAVVPTVSIGVVVADQTSVVDDLLRDADIALYRAKERGRGRVELFGVRLRSQADYRFNTEQTLRSALDNDYLRLHFQPIVDAEHLSMVGVEALLRIELPNGFQLLPGAFISVAEEAGLIGRIGEWVIADVKRWIDRWRSLGHEVPVSVNLAMNELFNEATLAALTDDDPQYQGLIRIELTERTLIDSTPILPALERLQAHRVPIALDDFGTAFSSITFLRNAPVDEVKIDRTFITRLGRDAESLAVVRAVIDLARAFGARTVAEGVETDEQLEIVRLQGIDLVQGYLVSRPLPPAALEARWLG